MYKAILFDWHGVLDLTTFEEVVVKIAKETAKSIDEVKAVTKKYKKPLIEGRISPDCFWSEIEQAFPIAKEKLEQIRSYSLSIEPNNILMEALPLLKKKYLLAVLSDCPSDKAEVIKGKSDLLNFDWVCFSCDEHLTKEDDAFFLNILKKMNLDPTEILYVDDTLKHVQKAELLGFNVHHFQNTQDFLNTGI
jgi:HAD superfamily hydrolase (TIGR01509 family)